MTARERKQLDDNLRSGGRTGGWRVKGSKSVPVAGDHSLEQEHSGRSKNTVDGADLGGGNADTPRK